VNKPQPYLIAEAPVRFAHCLALNNDSVIKK